MSHPKPGVSFEIKCYAGIAVVNPKLAAGIASHRQARKEGRETRHDGHADVMGYMKLGEKDAAKAAAEYNKKLVVAERERELTQDDLEGWGSF